jgi:type IX secretion system PorP/SprF family membrane protein
MKGNKLIFPVIVLLILLAFKSKAQQQVMFTQYMFNALAINPAYAGHAEALSITALGRYQWVGVDGAPNTQTLSAHSPIKKNKVALGVLFIRDKIGVTEQNGIFTSYAYKVKFGKKGTLSLGMQVGFSDYKATYSTVRTAAATNDPNFTNDDISSFLPNIGAGAFFSTQRFYVGFSSPFLLNNFVNDSNNSQGADQVRHFFAMTGFVVDLSRSLKLKPSGLLKMVSGAPLEMDFNANLIINDIFWVGLSWRTFDSIDLLLELQVNSKLRLGYAYDYTTTDLGRVNSGSHEIMLNYILSFSKTRVITPRYF